MKTILMCGPFSSRSGYGDHARSIFYALHESNKYDIKLWDVRWGDTPKNFLKQDNPQHKSLLDRLLPEPAMNNQPDVYIDIRIPNEFETFGKVNIGVTAGIETNAVSAVWIDGINRMNMTIVPSVHSKSSFINSHYDKLQDLPDGKKEKVGELRIEKPIEVIFEGADLDIYKPLKVNEIDKDFLSFINNRVPEKFAFLFVGQWVKGGFGEDRKDIGRMLKVFFETFANTKNQPALILKTSGAGFSLLDKADCKRKIQDIKNRLPSDWKLPNVYLLHGDLADEEMNMLYNHPTVKCLISFTHGEGFGRPLLEASVVGLPVICSNWSGPVDFLDASLSLLIGGKMVEVPKGAVWKDIVIPESHWFEIDENDAYKALKYCHENFNTVKERAKTLMRRNREKFSMQAMAKLIVDQVDRYTAAIPDAKKLVLPKLKKVGSDQPSKIKLPKLKKINA